MNTEHSEVFDTRFSKFICSCGHKSESTPCHRKRAEEKEKEKVKS